MEGSEAERLADRLDEVVLVHDDMIRCRHDDRRLRVSLLDMVASVGDTWGRVPSQRLREDLVTREPRELLEGQVDIVRMRDDVYMVLRDDT